MTKEIILSIPVYNREIFSKFLMLFLIKNLFLSKTSNLAIFMLKRNKPEN